MTPEKKTGKTTKKTRSKAKSKPKTTKKTKSTARPRAASKLRARTTSELPEQKLGDTPVPPWEMPTPEEKAKAKPVKRALKKAVAEIDSQAKADQVIERLEKKTAGRTAEEVGKKQPKKTKTSTTARKVKKAEEQAPAGKKAEKVLEETAKALTTTDKKQRELVSEAAQEVFSPEQQGAALVPEDEEQREYLRQAVLKRLKPLDALDANLFLHVNHLNHTRLLNTVFYGLTTAFSGGAVWYAVMGLNSLKEREDADDILWELALPLTVSGLLVEYPIKRYFRRRRPFISIIQAIVIGKKPGTWSFPSGHSATAFAGAWLLNHWWPRNAFIRYLIAGSVAFSRVYLGDHYPGDVVSGSLIGLVFARTFHWMAKKIFRR